MSNNGIKEAETSFATDPLRWAGYSSSRRITLNHMAAEYAQPISLYEKLPYCADSYNLLRSMSDDERTRIENDLLQSIDHSANLTPYLGVVKKQQAKFIQAQLEFCAMTMVQLMKIIAKDDSEGKELQQVCSSMSADRSKRFVSALKTCRHNYAQFNGKDAFANNHDQPLYLESAVDIMANGLDLVMAEFQVRYSAPYPHLIKNLNDASQKNFPGIFEKYRLKVDEFPARRLKMLNELYENFAATCKTAPLKVVIDGWAYLHNAGANWRQLSRELGADYLVFDEMRRSEKISGADGKLFVFNQVPVHQLDPSDPFYACINNERMENYDELGWDGINQRYRSGDICFAHAPITDVANDKALYDFLPQLCKIFFGVNLELPIISSKPCWSENNPNEIDPVTIVWALQNKDKCVITHRYLEGGSGIRIGAAMTNEEWNKFIGGYVVRRPYLYLIRDYFPMDPDVSLRVVTSSLSPSMQLDAPIDFACADSFLLRYSAQKPLTLKNARCLLALPSNDESAED